VKCRILYKGGSLQLTIYACYSWEIALNIGPDASFNNMQDWKGIPEKAREVTSMKASITNDKTSC
jgi:hypothetical protein